ncbi:hypothetical protein M9Y10_034536 [Tritrichomonas musculus]|uniref:CCR4-NOT transcription complex subunit 11 n=1 Tax=Tritrichomonas musculus TaxID=1915356 RepID=A0ABR2KFZ1_9EUKA
MEGLDEISHILENFKEENMFEIFDQIINSEIFKLTPVGVCGSFVSYFGVFEKGDRNEIMSQFLMFLFEKNVDPKLEILFSFLFLWIRSSDEQALDYQIKCLEKLSPQLHGYEDKYKNTNNYCHLVIAQLMERCQTYVLPNEQCNMVETLSSEDFLQKSPSLIRSKRAATFRGRLHMITTRIFPAFAKFAMSKGSVPLEYNRSEPSALPSIADLLQKIASSDLSEILPNDFKMIASYLSKVQCVDCRNRIDRIPSRVLTCLESLQNQASEQDPEVCLQIAIMCLILDKSNQENPFPQLVQKFASLCDIDGSMLVHTIKRAESTYLKSGTLEASYDISSLTDNSTPEIERPFKPLLSSFEIEPDQYETSPSEFDFANDNPIFEKESARKQIESFAGNDEKKWFAGNGIDEWRAGRLCVSFFLDRLDSKSISLIPED